MAVSEFSQIACGRTEELAAGRLDSRALASNPVHVCRGPAQVGGKSTASETGPPCRDFFNPRNDRIHAKRFEKSVLLCS